MKKHAAKTAPRPTPATPAVTITGPEWKSRLGLLLAALAFLLYANTIGHGYTVDDGTVISNNTITKKGISAIPEIFTSAYRAGFWDRDEGMYRPLSVAMFAAEYSLAPENPLPGHLINILLYALTVWLLFMMLARMFPGDQWFTPLLITLLFTIHPLHTEVVANIKSRDEILCLLFGVLSIDQLLRYMSSGKKLQLVFSAASFFLAFLSKESAITLLAVYPLAMWYFGKSSPSAIVRNTIPFVLMAVLYFVIRVAVLGSLTGNAEQQLINNSLLGAETAGGRVATALWIMGKYLLLLVFPHPLSFDYSYNQIPIVSFADIRVLLSLAALIFLGYTAVKGFRKKEGISFGILFFAATIALVSNLFFLIESTMAERFLYMPSLGMCIAAGILLSRLFKKTGSSPAERFKMNTAATMLTGLVVVLFSIKTVARNSDWKDNLTLLAKDVETSPNSARIRYAYGSALLIEKALKMDDGPQKTSFLDRSIAELERGVSILPSYAEAWYHLGLAYKEKKDPQKAVKAFETAKGYKNFKEADFYVGSGLAYGQAGQYDKALADFRTALAKDPDNAETYNNMGLYFTEKGVIDSALIYLDKAITMKKDFYQAWYNRGNTWAKSGDFNKAIADYNKSLEIKPGYTDAMLNLGNSYAAMADYKNALVWFEELLKLDPNNPKLLYNIGITYNFLGDTAKANEYISRSQGR